jgi:uncharacterized protein (TIGR03382 family)
MADPNYARLVSNVVGTVPEPGVAGVMVLAGAGVLGLRGRRR